MNTIYFDLPKNRFNLISKLEKVKKILEKNKISDAMVTGTSVAGAESNDSQGFVNLANLTSFSLDVSSEDKENINDCLQFANLAANDGFPLGTKEWYFDQVDTLNACGFQSKAGTDRDYSTSNVDFTVQDAIISSLSGLIGKGLTNEAIELAQKCSQKLDDTQDKDDSQTYYANNTDTSNYTRFLQSPVFKNGDDLYVAFAFGAFEKQETNKRFLWVNRKKTTFNIYTNITIFYMNKKNLLEIIDIIDQGIGKKSKDTLQKKLGRL